MTPYSSSWFFITLTALVIKQKSERADPPHHRCCHSSESLQPSLEERGCERAENGKERKNKMWLSSHVFLGLTAKLSWNPIIPCGFLLDYFSEEDDVHRSDCIWNLQRLERRKTREKNLAASMRAGVRCQSASGARWNYSKLSILVVFSRSFGMTARRQRWPQRLCVWHEAELGNRQLPECRAKAWGQEGARVKWQNLGFRNNHTMAIGRVLIC